MGNHWQWVKLGDICRLQVGLTYVSEQLRPPGRLFVTIKCFHKGGGFRRQGLKTFSGAAGPEYLLRAGDLLIANTDLTRDASIVGAPALTPTFNGEAAAFSLDVSRLVTDEARVDNRFLAYRLSLPDARSFMQGRSAGSTVLHLHTRDVPGFQFALPAVQEQRRIADVLDTARQTIAKTEQLIAKLEQVKRGLMHDLLTRGVDDNGELRDPGRHPERFKDSPLGQIPTHWGVAPFSTYASPNRPYLKTGPFGSSLKQEHWVAQGVPVITIGSLGQGRFVESELLHVNQRTAANLSSYAVIPGDIVFSRVADVGRSAVVGNANAGWILSSNTMWISLDRRRAVPEYVQGNISANWSVRRQIGQFVNSAGRDIANASIVDRLRLPWPPIAEQRHIASVIARHDERLRSEYRTRDKLRLIEHGLMKDLLTGRVRVP